jgi:hypothetical protein
MVARNGVGGGGDVMEGWQALARVLSQPPAELQQLTQLDVSGNALGAAGLAVLAAGVARSHSLRVLSLDDNPLVGPLSLDDNPPLVGPRGEEEALAGLEALAAALELNTSVQALSVRGCGLGAASVPVLVRALRGAALVGPSRTTAVGKLLCGNRPRLCHCRFRIGDIRLFRAQIANVSPVEAPPVKTGSTTDSHQPRRGLSKPLLQGAPRLTRFGSSHHPVHTPLRRW